MRKRKIKIKPRFWVILAVLIFVVTVMYINVESKDKTAKINECEWSADCIREEKDFLLNIPMSYELQEELHKATEEFGVDYYIMIALIDRETRFQNVLGDSGDSYGYCQIQPKWWYGLMTEIGATDLTVPKDNFRTACAIMARLTEKYHSTEGALVAYNQGYYNGNSTQYSREIIANAERYKA